MAFDPGDPRLLELRGILAIESKHPEVALIYLKHAASRGARATVYVARAMALSALGSNKEALEDWQHALDNDPEDPRVYLGRARTCRRLGLIDRALDDLEHAADYSLDNAALRAQITFAYAACLPSRPSQFFRWLTHARLAWSAWEKARHREN
jgi:tetratricopeptide (TPR) repeat protein